VIDGIAFPAGAAAYMRQSGKAQEPLSAKDMADRHKLEQAAGQFESMLLSSLWKSMKSSFADLSSEEEADPAHSAWEDMGMEAMAGAVSRGQGLGLGRMILKDLERKPGQGMGGIPEKG